MRISSQYKNEIRSCAHSVQCPRSCSRFAVPLWSISINLTVIIYCSRIVHSIIFHFILPSICSVCQWAMETHYVLQLIIWFPISQCVELVFVFRFRFMINALFYIVVHLKLSLKANIPRSLSFSFALTLSIITFFRYLSLPLPLSLSAIYNSETICVLGLQFVFLPILCLHNFVSTSHRNGDTPKKKNNIQNDFLIKWFYHFPISGWMNTSARQADN